MSSVSCVAMVESEMWKVATTNANVESLLRKPTRLVAGALLAGVTFNIGVRGGFNNAAVAFGVGVVVVLLLVSGRVSQRGARVCASAALFPAAFLSVRASPWLTTANWIAILGLLTLAAAYARVGSIADATPLDLLRRIDRSFVCSFDSFVMVHRLSRRLGSLVGERGRRIARAVLVTLPVLIVVAALLASADAVFASIVTPDIAGGRVFGHVALTVVFGGLVLSAAAATGADSAPRTRCGKFEATEIAVMLGLAALLLAVFAVAQLVALTDAGDRLVSEAGLTPAEYARGGFFQLCWATALILVFLGVVRSLAAPTVFESPMIRVLALLVPVLTLGLVAVSLERMRLYDQTFGLTMLRVYVVFASLWMGAVLVMIATRNAGFATNSAWLLMSAVAMAWVLLVGANIANPEAFVVRHNVERAARGLQFDPGYLAGLSNDATAEYVRQLERRSADDIGDMLRASLKCRKDRHGVAALNLATADAQRRRRAHCPSQRMLW